MNEITVTVIGNAVNDVEMRFTKAGEPVASFRVASGTRRYDKPTGRWVDGDTLYFSVSCWRSLAHNVIETVVKGTPVIVVGRLRSREVERPCGEQSHVVRYTDIEAQTVGVDLARGVATFSRRKREAVVESERRAIAEALPGEGSLADSHVDLETGELIPAVAAA